MRDKRKKSLQWFYQMLDSVGATYQAGTKSDHVIVTAANGRSMTLSAYDLENLSRRALSKRFERLSRDTGQGLEPYPFVPAVER